MPIPPLVATKWEHIRQDPASGTYWVDKKLGPRRRIRRKCASLAEAKKLLRQLDLVTREEGPPVLLSEIFARYRALDEAQNRNHVRHAGIERRFVRDLGDPRVASLSPAMVGEWQLMKVAAGCSPSTVNRATRRLHAVLNQAARDKLLAANPIQGYRAFRDPPGRLRWLQDEEEEALSQAMAPEDWRLVEIAHLSGMRQGEQFGCRAEFVRLDANVIHLPVTKGGVSRDVPMGDDLRQLVIEQLALGSDWLCPRPGRAGPWGGKAFYVLRFMPALVAAGIQDFRWHDLRHTYCSRLAMRGVPLRAIQLLAGHKSITVTERYAKLSPDHLHQAARVLDRPAGHPTGHPQP
jgi:integrase